MSKTIWQRIRKNHLLLMAVCCLAPIILIIAFLSLYKGSSNYWIWLIVLLCPILHILLMKGHKKKELYQCPECGFLYKEKEWVEKCKAWCSAHKSCNLEITAHAVKDKQDKV